MVGFWNGLFKVGKASIIVELVKNEKHEGTC